MKVPVKTRNQVVGCLTDAVARDYMSYAREGRSVVRKIILIKIVLSFVIGVNSYPS